MGLEKHLSTQTAILIAGALIAAGLFFGLRGREASPVPGPPSIDRSGAAFAPAPGTSDTSGVETPTQARPPPAVGAAPDRAALTAATQKELERYRPTAVQKCNRTAPPGSSGIAPAKFRLNVTYDGQGQQIARGFLEPRDWAWAGVGTCLNEAIPSLHVPAPGAGVMIELDWTFP